MTPPRVAIYARFSSEHQSATSIADQERLCRVFAERQGWQIVANYDDAAISGSSVILRPGIQALIRAALRSEFDIVLAEALDRLSRDLEDTARLFKRLTFAGVRIVTISEGDVTRLHVGLKGLMNEQFLDELAIKTRRGMRGRVEAGKSGGGICYGYRAISGRVGEREIDDSQAEIVRRIFREFIAGMSPKGIAKRLNAEHIAGPHGVAWSPSTIHGHASRGTGILNNELYVGRLVWNRQRFLKDPDTGKRVARLNPQSEWITKEVPELRIVADDLWQVAKARQAATRRALHAGIVRARRPKYLFSGLTRCAVCGGGFTLSSRDTLRCFNASSRGTCANTRTITRHEIESRVLRAIQERLFDPGRFAAFCEEFAARVEERRREHLTSLAARRRELDRVQAGIRKVIDAIKDGFTGAELKAEMDDLQARKVKLVALLAQPADRPDQVVLHPQMAAVFRESVVHLAEALQREGGHAEVRAALRQLVDHIDIPTGDGLLTVVGNLGAMLDVASVRRNGGDEAVGYVGCGGGI